MALDDHAQLDAAAPDAHRHPVGSRQLVAQRQRQDEAIGADLDALDVAERVAGRGDGGAVLSKAKFSDIANNGARADVVPSLEAPKGPKEAIPVFSSLP